MKVKFGGGIVAARGSIAGNVYSANASGAYVRAFAMPTNPDTTYQQAVRSLFGGISNNWKGLTSAQQNGWIEAAPSWPVQDSLGQTVILTGQQLFCRLNNSLLQVGESTIDDAPAPATIVDITSLTLTNVEDAALQVTVAWSDAGGVVPDGQALIIEATTGLSAGITAPKRPAFKQIQIVAATTSTAPVNILSAYTARLGAPVVGKKVFIRVSTVDIANGQRGQAFQKGDVVTATP